MTSKPSVYLGGALLANAPLIFFYFLLTFMRDQDLIASQFIISSVAFVLVFVGALIAGFLVAGRARLRNIFAGILTGIFSFVLYNIYPMVSYVLPHFLMVKLIELHWVLFGFISGGCCGGLLKKIMS